MLGLAAVLVPGLAVALSPVPAYAVMLMLEDQRGRTLASIFVAGWVAGLALLSYLVLIVVDGLAPVDTDQALGWISLVLAAMMLALALRQWLGRPTEGTSSAAPSWTREIPDFTAVRTLGVAVPLAAVSLRILVLAVAAMVSATAADVPSSGLVWFLAVSCCGVVVPLLIGLVAGQASGSLVSVREWTASNHDAIVITSMVLVAGAEVAAGLTLLA